MVQLMKMDFQTERKLFTMIRATATLFATLFICSAAFADLDTFTYISSDGGGSGAYEGDISGVLPVTVLDSDGGDTWNGGDQVAYVHQGAKLGPNDSYKAVVRVISQTQAIDGRWGKGGITATADLAGSAPTAIAQVAFGNGSQTYVNNDGSVVTGANPVPVRLGGRTANLSGGDAGFEIGIAAAAGYTGAVDGDGNVANVLESRWLSLEYNASTNEFVAGVARDINGVAGVWSYSAAKNDIAINDGGGHYIGLGYSAHDDLNFDQVARPDKLHGVTFEQFSLTVVPEPATFTMVGFGLLGLLGFRRRNR